VEIKMAYREKAVVKQLRELRKSRENLIKAKALRIWVERTPNVNIVTYPFMRITKRKEIREIENQLRRRI
jgi:hypothetical protein